MYFFISSLGKYISEFKAVCDELGYPYVEGITWTTDAFYRETPDRIAKRKEMGAICVEMECAPMQALCDFRGIEYFQFLYAGDNLDHSNWDPRSLSGTDRLDDKEKIATVRAIPFFSCGAKLPILLGIAGAIAEVFNFSYVDLITYSMYVLGIFTAVVTVLLMRNTTLKGDSNPFIMELPAYHLPQFKALMIHLWDKAKHFVKKAFTIILASTIVVWFLTNFGWNWQMVDSVGDSILGSIGQLIQPIFTPLGFGAQLTAIGWVFAVAAITGLIAKENVIATFISLGAVAVAFINSGAVDPSVIEAIEADEDGITATVAMIHATGITWQGCVSFIAFNMLTIPCFAACATARAELPKGKFKWTLLFWIATSYIGSAFVYCFLSMFSLETLAWAIPVTVGLIALAVAAGFGIHFYNKKQKAKKLGA